MIDPIRVGIRFTLSKDIGGPKQNMVFDISQAASSFLHHRESNRVVRS